jgi:diacylglycerol O-acyltransferase
MPPSGPEANAGLKTAGNMQSAPKTPLNVAVTNQRSFAARSIPLAEVKAIAKSSGTSLNDVVLALCAGALRRYLAEYNCKPRKPLIAGVPVSLRDTGNTDPTNQVAMILVSLATDIADPAQRLATISASASAGKQLTGRLKTAIPMDFPSFGVPWFMSGLASLYGRSRLADKLPPIVNVAISNVPGPQFPLYFAGAKLARWYPVSIPTHGVALNVTVLSYDGSLEVGLTACRSAVPDVADLGNYIVEEHNMLLAAMRSRNANAMDEATALAEPVEAKQLPSERSSTRVATRKPVSRVKDQQAPTGRTESPQRRKGRSTGARGTRASHG